MTEFEIEPNENLSLSGHVADSTATVVVGGEIDLATSEQLQRYAEGFLDDGAHDLVLDCAGITFMSSTGLRVVATLHQRVQEAGGTLTLVAPGASLQRLLDVTGLSEQLAIVPSTGGGGAPSAE